MTGPQFQDLRNSLGLTQSVLAERFGVSTRQIVKLEASEGDVRRVCAQSAPPLTWLRCSTC